MLTNLIKYRTLVPGLPLKPSSVAGLIIFLALSGSLILLYGYHDERLRTAFSRISAGISLSPPQTPDLPKKLWYKLGPKGFGEEARTWAATCIKSNPDYDVEFMTDETADSYVQATFGESDPDLVGTDLALPSGVYCDLDVSCHIPISDWILPEYKAGNASMVVGWEFDVGWGEDIFREFATWTIMSQSRSPHMWAVIQDILRFFKRSSEGHGVPIAELTLDMVGDVVDATGPRRFTESVMRSLKDSGFANAMVDDVKNLHEPKMAGDVLVLPGWTFAASENHYKTGANLSSPLVTHHYAGSWKNAKGGE